MIYDNLPDDLLDKCYSYIAFPQSKYLLKEIKDVYILKKLNNCKENDLSDIFYKALKIWHATFLHNLFNEFETEYTGMYLYINTYDTEYERKQLWIEEITMLFGLMKTNNAIIPDKTRYLIINNKVLAYEYLLDII
jgi:hypothetical protein